MRNVDDNKLPLTTLEVLQALQFARTHLYAAQAQFTHGDDVIIIRHVYDAYKRISEVAREVERFGIKPEN